MDDLRKNIMSSANSKHVDAFKRDTHTPTHPHNVGRKKEIFSSKNDKDVAAAELWVEIAEQTAIMGYYANYLVTAGLPLALHRTNQYHYQIVYPPPSCAKNTTKRTVPPRTSGDGSSHYRQDILQKEVWIV